MNISPQTGNFHYKIFLENNESGPIILNFSKTRHEKTTHRRRLYQ